MFIDVHTHVYLNQMPGPNGAMIFYTPEQMIERFDSLGIEKGVLLPLVSPECYIPQSNDEIIAIAGESGGRFVPFCNVDPRAWTNSPDAPLADLLRHYRDRGCKGLGEVMPNLRFDNPMVQNLFKAAEEVGFPVIFDSTCRIGGRYGLVDDVGLPQLEMSLRRFPELIILGHGPCFWAEIGKLETPADRCGYPAYPFTEEGVVPRLFRRYPNLYGDLSAQSAYNALRRNPEYGVKFMNEFQDRLLFGLDIVRPDEPARMVNHLLEMKDSGKITEEVFNKIAKQNAVRLLDL